jgi:hypothetical protein
LSSTNGNASIGNGDYHLTGGSPLIQMAQYNEQLIPFDLDGMPRQQTLNVPGSYSYYGAFLQSVTIQNATLGQ